MILEPSPSHPSIIEVYPDKFVIHPSTHCWLFTGFVTKKGYGSIRYNGKVILVHRLSAHFSLGLILDDLVTQVCHQLNCPAKHCANPAHLYLGNNSTNQRDAVILGTHVSVRRDWTHCVHGHPLSGDNLYIPADGRRRCVTCRKNNDERRQQKLKQQR